MYKARNTERKLVFLIIMIVVVMFGITVKGFVVEAWDAVEALNTRTSEIEQMFETIDDWNN